MALQVVNVVEIDALQEVHLRLDVAGHGEVNEQQRAVAAQLHQRFQRGAVENVMRRRGAADDDVHPLKFARPIFKGHRPPAQFIGQRHGLVMRAIRHQDAAGAAREQRAGGLLAGVSRADDHYVAVAQPAEDLLGQFHRHRADRDAAALDVGCGADVLGDVERALEGLVQPPASMAGLEGEVVGLLKLAEDFRLPEHHRVQAARDFEQMVQALRLAPGVYLVGQRVAVVMAADQKVPEGGDGPGRLQLRHRVDLNAVAGGQNHRFVRYAGGAQRLERGGHTPFGKGELLSH